MRLISEDGKTNLSFDNWDFEIRSPYLYPPVFYIKATSDHRDISIASFKNIESARYVFNEIQKCYSNGEPECNISKIIERTKSNGKIQSDNQGNP